MNSTDVKDPVLADFTLHHPVMAKRLIRDKKTGCLEYRGPSHHIVGNPIIGKGGKSSVLLRRYIYEQYKGNIPAGKFVRMRCRNRTCHAIGHMILDSKHNPYNPASRDYLSRYDSDALRAIRYYRGRVDKYVLSEIFKIPANAINGIWISRSLSKTGPGPHYRPAPDVDARVEKLSAQKGSFRYLSRKKLNAALAMIKKSNGSPNLIRVVEMVIERVPLNAIARKIHRSKGTVNYWFRRGLIELTEEFGDQPWIEILSKGQLRRWKISPYNRGIKKGSGK